MTIVSALNHREPDRAATITKRIVPRVASIWMSRNSAESPDPMLPMTSQRRARPLMIEPINVVRWSAPDEPSNR